MIFFRAVAGSEVQLSSDGGGRGLVGGEEGDRGLGKASVSLKGKDKLRACGEDLVPGYTTLSVRVRANI